MSKHGRFNISFGATLQRWKATFKKITHDTLNSMDENNFSDEKIDALFNNKKNMASFDESMSPKTNSLVDLKLTDEPSMTSSQPTDSNSTTQEDTQDQESMSFDNYDAVAECAKLREQIGEPFYHAETIWKKRRELWNKPSAEFDEQKDLIDKRKSFKAIPGNYYPRIYKKLVVDDKPLREPLNLKDVIDVINSGWIETRKWANAAQGLP